jgi:hypothetical protein
LGHAAGTSTDAPTSQLLQRNCSHGSLLRALAGVEVTPEPAPPPVRTRPSMADPCPAQADPCRPSSREKRLRCLCWWQKLASVVASPAYSPSHHCTRSPPCLGERRSKKADWGWPHVGAVACRLVPRCLGLALPLCRGRRPLPTVDLDADEREREEERMRYKEKKKRMR